MNEQPPTTPASLNSGANVRQMPKPAPMGAVAGSYDPKARPASALKSKVDGFKDKVQSRCDEYLKRNPDASRKEAMQYAMASKSARRAYKSWRKAS